MDSDMETYAIINATDLDGLDFDKFRQNSADTCRRSVDGIMALVSWFGDMPSGVEPIATYPADEIREVISGEEWTPVIEDNFSIGAYYRRSEALNEDGLYTIESSTNPILSDGTILTKSNKDTYDGSEGWHWYDSGQVVDLNVTPTRWESIKNWFTGLF